jgi:hypothetical protein
MRNYVYGLAISLFMMAGPVTMAIAADLKRTPEGHPDLSGIWQVITPANQDLLAHAARKDSPAHLGAVVGNEIPYQTWALAKKAQNFKNRETADPSNQKHCYMPGVPRITYVPLPFQIFQTDKKLKLLYEFAHSTRDIYTNSSKHPDGHIDWFLGDSRGHWEGDTLVVDVVDFNDETWLDHAGDFHSDALHVVERYKPLDADHIQYEATLDDPKVFTKPWTVKVILYRRVEPDVQLLEYECYTFDYEQYYP